MKLNHYSHKKGHLNLRLGRYSQSNGIYLITTTTWQRSSIFTEWGYAHAAVQAFTRDEILKDAQLLCWVLMPDHAHRLLQLGKDRDLSSLIRAMKSASAYSVRKAGYTRKVWARSYHDRTIHHEDHIEPAARYIVANPLRAGLVMRVGDYPFWSAVYL